MKLSPEELEKIKKAYKKPQASNGDGSDYNDDEGDQDFISNRGNQSQKDSKDQKNSKAKRENVYQQLKKELSKASQKLHSAFKTPNANLNNPDSPTENLKNKQFQPDSKSAQDEIAQAKKEYEENNSEIPPEVDLKYGKKPRKKGEPKSVYETFIHSVKTGMWGHNKAGEHAKNHMGQVNLGGAVPHHRAGFVEKLKHSGQNHNHER